MSAEQASLGIGGRNGAARPPAVIVLIGLPGAGKSQIAEALERELDMHRICRDSIRHAMFPRCENCPAEKRAANNAAMRALEVNCAMGRNSVLDGRTFSRLAERIEVEQKVRGWGAVVHAVYLDCPVEVAKQRINDQPSHPAKDRTPELVDAVASRFEPPGVGCVVVDGRRSLGEMTDYAVRAIRDLLVFGELSGSQI
ncbi:AAA family ATPase [Pseudomarimonas arenosa]|uniref:ATP-binding protein n=1 Tax=Pseudomarimonas arenosa TaxID=2774145 RepID=A0AAW3ZNJ0_9GAMM|nr:ATP-binding protein [Pseudomarimonas arenosa]MBD8527104.1 ATP-binding protein [Pseudomarimonas arenosa]